jgi:hypothetical protein
MGHGEINAKSRAVPEMTESVNEKNEVDAVTEKTNDRQLRILLIAGSVARVRTTTPVFTVTRQDTFTLQIGIGSLHDVF